MDSGMLAGSRRWGMRAVRGGLARAITVGSIVLTVVSLTVAVRSARSQSRIRVGFDAARVVAGEGGLFARRSPMGIVLWGAGIVVMQAAGIAPASEPSTTVKVCSGACLTPLRGAAHCCSGSAARSCASSRVRLKGVRAVPPHVSSRPRHMVRAQHLTESRIGQMM